MSTTTSASSFSDKDFIFAWAARVSVCQMAASVEAHVRTKAAITMFRLAVKHSQNKSLGRLPEEIVAKIALIVGNAAFRQFMGYWTKFDECMLGRCTLEDHFYREEIEGRARGPNPGTDWGKQELVGRHICNEELYSDIIAQDSPSALMKCVRSFAEEFGIRPYITCTKALSPYGVICEIHARAYLILPVSRAPIWDQSRPGVSGFMIDGAVDTSIFRPVTEVQRVQFQTAARVLQLHAYDPDEDELVFMDGTATTNLAPGTVPPQDADAATQDKEIKPEMRFFALRELETRYLRHYPRDVVTLYGGSFGVAI